MVASTLTDTRHNPWRSMREEYPEWGIHFAPSLPRGALGMTRWLDSTVWLVSDLTQVERRCILEHERQHIIRGVHSCDDVDELAVEQTTARTLIPLDELLDALRRSRDPLEVADSLWTTHDVLASRIQHLHPAERAAVAGVIAQHRGAA